MAAAATAYESWRETTPSERSLALFRIADADDNMVQLVEAALQSWKERRWVDVPALQL